MSEPELYSGREQTLVKHFILRKYLERFARIVGTFADSITYVDCFSGPWNVLSEELKDSSFSIALEELRKARTTLAQRGRLLKIRCLFLEKQPGPYAKLEEFAKQVEDVEIQTRNSELADSINEILQFVRAGGRGTFPFFFIDPTGWTGFEMQLIGPLLRQRPGEVLINFMMDHIRRFINHPQQQTQEQFAALFGSGEVKDVIQALADSRDRENALSQAYAENVKKGGGFTHICTARVLYPVKDRSYFHLIYGTRSRKGVEVFKDVEKRAMEVMEQTRAQAKQTKRVKKTKQRELFSGEFVPHSRPIDALRDHYLGQARDKIRQVVEKEKRVPYESVWDLALSYPLVWESDLKEWMADWRKEGLLQIQGLKTRQRVPKLEGDNVLVWQTPSV
jgi:three-Cys-motif partner protein